MLINTKFLLKHKHLIEGMYLNKKKIRLVKYTSFEQQENNLCTIFFIDNTFIIVKDNQNIEVSVIKLCK